MEPQAKKAKMAPPPPPNMTLKALSICRDCNLVFLNAHALRCHNETEHHRMASNGMRPPQGNFFCFLCWQGFRHMDDLRTHYNREQHEENARSHRVKAIWMSRFNDCIDVEEGSTSPVSLTSSEDESEEPSTNQCVPCNLVFSSPLFLQRHLSTKTHATVLTRVVDKNSFSCLLCCQAFQVKNEFLKHVESNLHKSFMRSNGVTGFVEKVSAEKVQDFVVMNEVGNDEEQDVLEEISSSEDEASSPIKPADLEEVSSPEHDFNEDEHQEVDSKVAKKELEDIHSEEDEISLSESEPEQDFTAEPSADLKLPEPSGPSEQKDPELEEIHSEEEIDSEVKNEESAPVMNNQDSLEAVSSPESKASDEADDSLAFVDRVELIYE